MTNSFLPSLLGVGDKTGIWPAVSRTGSGLDLLNSHGFSSRIAQILACDSKMKYFPSGVQVPQHSVGGLCQPGSNGWGLVPSAETSHSPPAAVVGSCTVKSTFLPSGDQR